MSSFARRNVVWFRNDLRLRDNPILNEVVKRGSSDTIFVYCFDPRFYKTTKFGSFKTGIYRAKFIIEAVANLRKNLRHIGGDLLVTSLKPEDIIPSLFSEGKTGNVFFSEDTTSEEINIESKVQNKCSRKGIELIKIRDFNTLYHPDDIPFADTLQDMPDTFTTFREKLESKCHVRQLLPTIQAGQLRMASNTHDELMLAGIVNDSCGFDYLPTLDMLGFPPDAVDNALNSEHINKGVYNFIGGEDEALMRIENWMFRDDHLQEYFEIRNGMLGEAYSSKLSPWLAIGCISPRFVIYIHCPLLYS